MERIRTGAAYHGNRILRHVADDMAEMARRNMDVVVHMFSHNDWDRHLGVMSEICKISEYNGLEIWIDNWGTGGPPGDTSYFLQYHPEAHQVYSDGSVDPVSACYNSPAFVAFTKNWIEAVASFGGKKIFWDEPHFKQKSELFSCCCPTCQKLFEEKYGHPMPTEMTDEMREFRVDSLLGYFDTVCSYAASMGIENSVCVMLHTLDYAKKIMTIPTLNDFGIDPYWHPKSGKHDPYEYVYKSSKQIIAETEAIGKQNHIWIQSYSIPRGHEDEIIVATDAAYDAGARTLISWSFRGGESNTYKSECCERAWAATCEAFDRVRSRHFDKIREDYFKKFN